MRKVISMLIMAGIVVLALLLAFHGKPASFEQKCKSAGGHVDNRFLKDTCLDNKDGHVIDPFNLK